MDKPQPERDEWREMADAFGNLLDQPAFAPEWFAERRALVARWKEMRGDDE